MMSKYVAKPKVLDLLQIPEHFAEQVGDFDTKKIGKIVIYDLEGKELRTIHPGDALVKEYIALTTVPRCQVDQLFISVEALKEEVKKL